MSATDKIKNHVKRKIIIFALTYLLPFFLVIGLLGGIILTLSGGGGTAPIPNPVSKEKAQEYGIIGNELGVPYDLLILIDFFLNKDKNNIEDINPLKTALEFMYIQEEVYTKHTTTTTTTDYSTDPPTTHTTTTTTWEHSGTNYYRGTNEILSYLGKDLLNINVLTIIEDIKEKCEAKTAEATDNKYEINISIELDFLDLMRQRFPELTEDERLTIQQLFDSHYIAILYSEYISVSYTNWTLTDLEPTRENLLRVSTAIMNHPYLLGGKYSKVGPPTGPLDCSGFVDWVYVQLFGKTVGRGGGTALQWNNTIEIEEKDLKIGDLGFYHVPKGADTYNHVGIYIGKIDGKDAFIHCGGKTWGTPTRPNGRVVVSINDNVTMNNKDPLGVTFTPDASPSNFRYFRRTKFNFTN